MSFSYKVAFIGWNNFQFLYVKTLLEQIPNSKFLVLKRVDGNSKLFTNELIGDLSSRIKFISFKEITNLDKVYDVIIAQTAFYGIHKIKNAKLIFLQYGYAKEPYNFAKWRAFGDLTLVYGDYAKDKIKKYTPAESAGNPRFDKLYDINFYDNCKNKYLKYIDNEKKTILYAPTWGDLSSFDLYIDSIIELSVKFNLLIKLHHNTEMLEFNRMKKLKKHNINYFGKYDDILELIIISDLVISDYSGAIFDAFYCNKPLVLLNIDIDSLLKSKKIDFNSIEFSKRDTLGITVNNSNELEEKIEKAFYQELTKEQITLRKKLFLDTNNACNNIISIISSVIDNRYIKTRQQLIYQKEICKEHNSYKRAIKEFAKNIYLYILYIMRKI